MTFITKERETAIVDFLRLRRGRRISMRWRLRKLDRKTIMLIDVLQTIATCASTVAVTGLLTAPLTTLAILLAMAEHWYLAPGSFVLVGLVMSVWRSWKNSLRPTPWRVIRQRYLRQMAHVRGFYGPAGREYDER